MIGESNSLKKAEMDELAAKYNIRYVNGKRYYEVDMTDPLLILEETVPYLFRYKDIEVCSMSWNKMTIGILTEIDKINPKTEQEFLSISYDWTKAVIFSETPRTNYSKYKNLYLNTNHTSTHSMMNIQGLLRAYGIPLSECYFLIRRHFVSEPVEVKNAIKEKTISEFSEFLSEIDLSDKQVSTVISNFTVINSYLGKVSPGYNDFLLFDDYQYFSSYKDNVLQYLSEKKHYSMADGRFRVISKCLDYLDRFYYYRNICMKNGSDAFSLLNMIYDIDDEKSY